MRIQTIVLSACLAAAPLAFAGKLVKWTDENGTVHYSDQAPPHAQVEKLNIRTGTSAPVSEKSGSEEKEPAKPDDAQKPQPRLEVESKESLAIKAKNCERARSNLAALESAARIREEDPATGQLRYLPDEEKKAKTDQSRKDVEKYCSP